MTTDSLTVTALLALWALLAVLWATSRARAERAKAKTKEVLDLAVATANRAEGVATILAGEVALLTAALARRDALWAEDLVRLEAMRVLEDLARRGYGPAFTQGAVSASGSLEVFGPSRVDFARAVIRSARPQL
jgi:hypothetical protein